MSFTPTLLDFTTLADTGVGTVDQVGTITSGVVGWIPKAANWRVSGSKVVHGTTAELSANLIYHPSYGAQTQRFAVQANSLTGTGFCRFGVYNPATGKLIGCRWNLNLASPTLQINLFTDLDGAAPAGTSYNLPFTVSPASYSNPVASDWAVMTVIPKRHSYAVTVEIFADNGANAPDFTSVSKTTLNGQFLFREFEEAGFTLCPFLGPSGESGTDHNWNRVIIYTAPQFTCSTKALSPGQQLTVSLSGKHTTWTTTTRFTVTSSLGAVSKLLQTVTSATSATLVIRSPANCSTLTVSDGQASQIILVNPTGTSYDTRTVWVTTRNVGSQSYLPLTGLSSASLVPSGELILYSVTPNYSGSKLWWLDTNARTSVSGPTPTGAADITLSSTTPTSPRKGVGLPDGKFLVFSSNATAIYAFDTNDTLIGVWGNIPSGAAYGGCLFADPTRGDEVTVLVSNFHSTPGSQAIYQLDLSGNYIGVWASGENVGRSADLQWDGEGHVYSLDWGASSSQGSLRIWTAQRGYVGSVTHSELINPFGICMLSSGELLIACENTSKLAVFGPGGYNLGMAVGGSTAFGGSLVDVNVVPV